MTAAMLEGERLIIAQVGDSRAYLLHQGKLQQLTRDHSLMADMIEAGQLTPEEARSHPNRSVITRALGSDPHTQPDLYEINVETVSYTHLGSRIGSPTLTDTGRSRPAACPSTSTSSSRCSTASARTRSPSSLLRSATRSAR